MTKRDKPAMSEEEFEKAIKELAQKESVQVHIIERGHDEERHGLRNQFPHQCRHNGVIGQLHQFF